jgi:hypothetical protein
MEAPETPDGSGVTKRRKKVFFNTDIIFHIPSGAAVIGKHDNYQAAVSLSVSTSMRVCHRLAALLAGDLVRDAERRQWPGFPKRLRLRPSPRLP